MLGNGLRRFHSRRLGSFDFDDDAPDEFLNFLSLLCHAINIHYEYGMSHPG